MQAGVTPYFTYMSATNWKIDHNTYNFDFASNTASFALYMFGSGHKVRNNIFANTSSIATSMTPVYIGGTTVADSFNYNLFYNVASTNVMNIAGTLLNTSNYKVAWPGGAGANSVFTNPLFLGTTNMHVNSSLACVASAPNVGITVDMDGETRPGTTVMGADHVVRIVNDLGIDSLLTPPTASITPGAQDVRVRIVNTGSANATSGDITLILNGGAPVVQSLASTLNACDTTTITFSGINFLAGFNSLLIYTSNPNGVPDSNTVNDTLNRTYCSPISGTFTINQNIAASGSNFTSINSAVSAIYACGISGPIVLNITTGTGPYNEQVLFNGMVPGSSPSNTVTINGGATKETVQLSGPSNASQHIFRLLGTKWVTLKNMTIKTLSPNWGVGVHICYNPTTLTPSDSNTVDSNIIILTGTTDSRNCGIAISTNSTFVTGTGNNGNNNTISNNSITNGYFGITCMGQNLGTETKRNKLINNTINNTFYYGIYSYYQDSLWINGNNVNMVGASNVNSYGIIVYDINRFQFKNNKVNNCGFAGVYFNGYTNWRNGAASTGLADRSEVSNNMIGGRFYGTGTVYGMFFSSTYCKNVDIFYNTISVSTPGIQFSYGLFLQYSTNGYYDSLDLRNNNVSVYNSSGYSAYLYNNTGLTPASMFTQCNNNNFFNSDASINHVIIGTTAYAQNTWLGINGLNVNSTWLNPNYNNYFTDLHTIHPNLNATGTPVTVVTDIDGNARHISTPDIGADEFTPSGENTGVTVFTAPGFPMTPGLQNIGVQFKNYGTATITNVSMRYKIGINGAVVDSTWNGSLAPGNTTSFTFSGTKKYNFTGSLDTIFSWTELPNGLPDGYPANDSLTYVICSPLSGTYTVNSGGATAGINFNNFNDLKTRLSTCGVSGLVTVEVATGTYTEQVTFTPVAGANATNRIIIKSATGNKADVLWQWQTSTNINDNFIVKLDGADYFTFRDMSFSTSSNILWSTIFYCSNVASANHFINNNLTGNNAQNTSLNQALIQFLNPTGAFGDDSVVISKNVMTSGTYGIYAVPATPARYNWTIDSNIMNNVYYMGMYIGNQRNSKITRNIYTNNTGYTNAIAFYLVSNQSLAGGNFEVSGNKISGLVGPYAVYMASNTASNTAFPILFMNNMIQTGNGGSTFTYSLFSTSNSGVRFYNNSFNSTNTNVSYYTCYFAGSSTPANEVKHNIIANSGNGVSAAGYAAYFQSNNTLFWQADSNLYYVGTGSPGLGYAGSGFGTNMAQWMGFANPNDQSSISVNPLFVNTSNLHTTSVPNLLSISPYGVVATDIDGQSRCNISDVGADHHPVTNDAGVSGITYPSAGIAAAGLQTIRVVLRNYGSANLTTANVSYDINGTVVRQAWTGNIAPCAVDTVTFATQYLFTGGSFVMKSYTDTPNTVVDPNVDNDTIYTSGCIGLSGVYTINSGLPNNVGGNYSSFKNAVNAMSLCGIGGPVTFNVAAGAYYEQIDIPAIVGQSSTNTITFDGGNGNAATRILSFRVTNASFPYVVRINSNSYINFRNLTINNSANIVTAGMSNVYLYNSSNIRISKCILGDSTVPASLASTLVLYRVAVSGHPTVPTTTTTTVSDNIFIDSNTIQYGYYGVFVNMNNSTGRVYVRGNSVDRPYYGGIWFQGGASIAKVLNNRIDNRVSGTFAIGNFGIYVTNAPAVTDFNDISGNRIDSTAGYGIFSTASGALTNYNVFSNNMIYGFINGSYYGLYNSGSYCKIYHNSIAYDFAGASTTAGYYQVGGTNNTIDVRNNIFAVTNSLLTGAVPMLVSAAGPIANLDYNIYYNVASINLVRINASNITTATYQNPFPTGGGINSVNINPLFLGAADLHIPTSLGCTVVGAQLSVTKDFDGETRSVLAPIIGADEIIRVNNDLSVDGIITPATAQVNVGANNMKLIVKNVGQNPVTSGDITYTVNGGAPVTSSIPGSFSIAPCDTMHVYLTGVVFANGSNAFKAYTTIPNGIADGNPSNDTIIRTMCTGLSGTFTIGGVTPSYATLTAAVNALNCGGVQGPVIFNIRPGTYNESVEITSLIGSSATNTVTFQSETGVATAIITRSTSSPTYVIKLNNADNVIFKNLDINSTTNVNAVQIYPSTDTCDNIQIRNCKLSTGLTTPTTTYAAVITLGRVNNLKIVNNVISRSAGLIIQGNNFLGAFTPGIEIDSNRFDSSVGASYCYKPIIIQWANAPKIRNNVFNRSSVGGASGATQDISIVNVAGAGEFSYNRVYMNSNISSFSPVYLNIVNNNGETTPFRIYNNFFYVANTANTFNSLRIDNSSYIHVYHNTFNFVNITSPTTCRNIYTTSSGFNNNVRILNNIFKSSANLYSLQLQGSTAPIAAAMITECNYNNYFQGTGLGTENILSINGVLYTSTTMKGAIYASPNNDLNSVFGDPSFISATDLRVGPSASGDGKAVVIPSITNDIFGNARKMVAGLADMGAQDSMFVRFVAGDYISSTGCVNISGTAWIDVFDTSGKIVFSINPEGNNLGPTCWGIRINSGAVRNDSVYNSADGLKYRSYFLDRNFYINPTTQPAPGTAVSIRMYLKQNEWNALAAVAAGEGKTLNAYYLKVNRYHTAVPTATLTPQYLQPSAGDSSHFLYTTGVINYGNDKRISFRTSSFSQFNPSFVSNTPPLLLPVTWSSFTAKVVDKNTNLDWATASEKNTATFVVERSSDGKEFTPIAKQNAAGFSQSTKFYSHIDKNAAGLGFDKLYYRIKQIDKDDNFDYSVTKAVNFKASNDLVINYVGPNPFKSELQVDFDLPSADKVIVSFFDINGQSVKSFEFDGLKGNNAHTLKVPELSNGVYFIKIVSGEFNYSEKVIKQD